MAYKVGLVQFCPKNGRIEENAKISTELTLEAISKEAKIIVLPELCNSGYLFENRTEALRFSETVNDSTSIKKWGELTKKYNVYIVAGLNEKDSDNCFNSAVLIGPNGLIDVYRKIHLWDEEMKSFSVGTKIPKIHQLPFAKVSFQICYDLWFPELSRIQALEGAELICVPTNWSPTPDGKTYDENGLFEGHYLMKSNSIVNNLTFACANRVGFEKNLNFLGGSCVINSRGDIIEGVCSREHEEVKIVEIEKNSLSQSGFISDRRSDVYQIISN